MTNDSKTDALKAACEAQGIDYIEFNPLPDWAVAHATPGKLELGAQLATRDGRRTGNAHIIEIMASRLDKTQPYYRILTDAGSLAVMTASEIMECFYPPKYISNAKGVVAKFGWHNAELMGWVPPKGESQ